MVNYGEVGRPKKIQGDVDASYQSQIGLEVVVGREADGLIDNRFRSELRPMRRLGGQAEYVHLVGGHRARGAISSSESSPYVPFRLSVLSAEHILSQENTFCSKRRHFIAREHIL